MEYNIGSKTFNFSHPFVMGILNVTPDSFSDGGKYLGVDAAVSHALKMIDEGAEIIDVGGESTRPRADPVSLDEELNRVIPAIEKILDLKPDTILSIDTTKNEVAEEALKAGAAMVNDISGLTFDPRIADTVAKYDAAIIVMHIKGTPKIMQQNPVYENLLGEVASFLFGQSSKAKEAGVKKIILDPGIGFGKTSEHNFEIIRNLQSFVKIGFPVMIGVSRKSFIGKLLNLETEGRDMPTAAMEAAAILNGARIIRTHNVKFGKQVCTLMEKLI
jgi:dihydropteroate synthase